MRQELEQKLADEFEFMRPRQDTNKTSYIDDLYKVFGCECGDGWFRLLWALCGEIRELYDRYPGAPKLIIEQVKEKYAQLHFYYSLDYGSDDPGVRESCDGIEQFSDEIYDTVFKYEEMSTTVCELCGSEGKVRANRSWITTLCDECAVGGKDASGGSL